MAQYLGVFSNVGNQYCMKRYQQSSTQKNKQQISGEWMDLSFNIYVPLFSRYFPYIFHIFSIYPIHVP